jgi:hypothetical protein
MRSVFYTSGFFALLVLACGGSQPPPEEPTTENTVEAPSDMAPPADAEKPAGDEGEGDTGETKAEKKQAPEPTFKENGTVDEAIAAVPPGTERLNIDQETLGKPLQDMALYEPCKPGNARIKFRVAVWDGKAVGLDLTSTPKNPKLEECLKGRIRELTWRDKVKALNTVEYQL